MLFVSRQTTGVSRRRLGRLLAGNAPFDIVEAALWVAAEEYPGLYVRGERERVRRIADEARSRAENLTNPFARLDAVRELIFGELGFRGDVDSFDDPRNSFINEVLRRRQGIPLTLSLIFMEAATAAGFLTRGIGLPGHFVCRLTFDGRSFLVDPFNEGQVITEEDCRHLVARTTGRPSRFRPEHLDGVDDRAMLIRLLLNLKQVYLGRADYARALSAVDRLLLVAPDNHSELRDRGFLKAHLGQPRAAIADLEAYLSDTPEAPDAESVRGRLAWLRRRASATH